jgi:hypothetical protein
MIKILLKCTFFLVIVFTSNYGWSQQEEYIIGRLLDVKTQEPIAFASIQIKDRALGVISNTDGSFKIPLKYKEYGDIIEIFSMGYQTKEMLIHDFSIYELNNVRLVPAPLELEEAILTARRKNRKKLSAKRIVEKAILAIPENYSLDFFSTVGYYRDYQLDNGNYINLNEAILEVFDQGFKADDTVTTKTLIYDSIKNKKFKRDTLSDNEYDYKTGNKIIDKAHLSGYGGNEFSTLRVHDAIRNYNVNAYDFINNMKEGDVLKNHSFKKLSDIYFDDKVLYVIKLNRRVNGYAAIGKMYISKNDFSIHKFIYALYDDTKENGVRKPEEVSVKAKLIFEINTEYQRNINNKMYLNYISFHNAFQIKQPAKFTLKSLSVDFVQQKFVLTFTSDLGSDGALDYANFKGYFKRARIKFERLIVLENQVWLFPKLESKKQLEMWQELKTKAENEGLGTQILNFDINNISDIQGNVINERELKKYNQFREFFVQEVKLNPQMPKGVLFMHNRKPIFENQPIAKPDNFDDYWMNTPLQNIEN